MYNSFRTTPPPIKSFEPLVLPSIQTLRDEGGKSRILVTECGNAPANLVSFFWNFGPDRMGGSPILSLTMPMLLQGTRSFTGAQIADRIDFLGAYVTPGVTTSYCTIDTTSLNRFTPELLELVEEVVENSDFPAERFEALKRKELARYDLLMSRTSHLAQVRLSTLLAGKDHPYCRQPSRSEIEAVTLNDVKQCWKEGVLRSELTVLATGMIDSQLREKLTMLAGKWKPIKSKSASVLVPYQPETSGTYTISKEDASQTSVAIGLPISIGREHPDYIPLRMAVTALGGYFGSRLNTNIREKLGLTYGISAYLASTPEGTALRIHSDCDPRYVKRVIEEINRETESLCEKTLPEDELLRLLSYYTTTQAAVLESFRSIASYRSAQLTAGFPEDYFERQQKAIQEINSSILKNVAKQYIHFEKAITVIAGPKLIS